MSGNECTYLTDWLWSCPVQWISRTSPWMCRHVQCSWKAVSTIAVLFLPWRSLFHSKQRLIKCMSPLLHVMVCSWLHHERLDIWMEGWQPCAGGRGSDSTTVHLERWKRIGILHQALQHRWVLHFSFVQKLLHSRILWQKAQDEMGIKSSWGLSIY